VNKVRLLLQRLPLVGDLGYAPGTVLWNALLELLFIWILTSIPLLVNSFIDFLSEAPPADHNRVIWCLTNNLRAGEVFIYVNAFLAPVFVVIYKYNRDLKYFRHHMAFLLTIHLLVVLSAVLFGLARGGMKLDPTMLTRTAIAFYLIALCMRYLSMISDSFRNYTDVQRDQEKRLTTALDGFTGAR
jgi:hypothetical protein